MRSYSTTFLESGLPSFDAPTQAEEVDEGDEDELGMSGGGIEDENEEKHMDGRKPRCISAMRLAFGKLRRTRRTSVPRARPAPSKPENGAWPKGGSWRRSD